MFPNNRHGQSKQDTLSQGCPNSVLEGHCPVDFRYNQVQTTRLEYSSLPGETLISWFRCVFIGVEAKLCRTRASRTECGCPALSLPLSLTPTLPASSFLKPVQKVRLRFAREIWALIKTTTGIQQSASVTWLAQSVEHETHNLRVVGPSPMLGLSIGFLSLPNGLSVFSISLDLSLLTQLMCGMHSVGILAPHSRGLYVPGLCGAIG